MPVCKVFHEGCSIRNRWPGVLGVKIRSLDLFNEADGCVSAVDSEGRIISIADAHRDGKRFVVRADEKLTAFVELQRAIHEFAVDLIS